MPNGSCLCGAVEFTVSAELIPPVACHCAQCRKQSGHYWAASDVARDALTIIGQEHLSWFQSSPGIQRGFCQTCGSFLFWDDRASASISVAMGAFDAPTATTLGRHIFVADQGDYYTIADGLPQRPQ